MVDNPWPKRQLDLSNSKLETGNWKLETAFPNKGNGRGRTGECASNLFVFRQLAFWGIT
jgi:hypothetical protein